MSEMSSKEYPVQVKKKKTIRKGGWKITATSDKNNDKCNQLMKMFLLFYWHLRKRRAYKQQLRSHPISEYNAMHKKIIPFIPLYDFLSHIKRYIVYIFLSKVLPFFVSFRDHKKFKKQRRKCLDNTAQMSREEIVKINRSFFS